MVTQAKAQAEQDSIRDLTRQQKRQEEGGDRPAPPQPFAQRDLLYIPADKLVIDHGYQRDLNASKVNKIARTFEWDSFGILLVAERATSAQDGTYVVMDGQHRVAAVRALGMGHVPLPCFVHGGMTYQREAKVFSGVNLNRTGIPVLKAFHALRQAGDATACDIDRIVTAAGYQVAESLNRGGAEGEIVAMAALERIYKGSPEDLAAVLTIIGEAYGTESMDSTQMWFLQGLWIFLKRFRSQYQHKLLVQRLHDAKAGILLNEGRLIASTGLCDRQTGVARAIHKAYNYRLMAKRLPAWDGGGTATGGDGREG